MNSQGLIVLFGKAITLLRREGMSALISKARRYIYNNRPELLGENEWDLLRAKLHGQPLAIVVDHDIGGGANFIRNQYVLDRRAKGDLVLLLGFYTATSQYFIEIFGSHSSRRCLIGSPELLLPLAACGEVRHATYNCAVTFRQPLAVIDTLIELKRQSGCELLVVVLDFFPICPSHFLMDCNDRFCGVPDEDQCKRCLAHHRNNFVSTSGIRDISLWRQHWSRLLVAADEVRLLSNSSKQILKRAYPSLSEATWRVVPPVLHTQMPKVQVAAGQYLHIGIVGKVTRKLKGTQIISNLASEIAQRNSNAKITVIGTLETKIPNNIVKVTGAYDPEHLSEIIKNSGANIFLFPSIWAETFSFVSHELVAMGVPFACFDFGAQAELARTYEKGLILDSMNAGDILNKLEIFWRDIYRH
jgi:glycosyltransferase involved in cell wall biosynthesis